MRRITGMKDPKNAAELVVIRKFRDGGDVIALWPRLAWNTSGSLVTSYQHIGQHGGADYAGVMRVTVPASKKEIATMLRELRTVGYKKLRAIQRWSGARMRGSNPRGRYHSAQVVRQTSRFIVTRAVGGYRIEAKERGAAPKAVFVKASDYERTFGGMSDANFDTAAVWGTGVGGRRRASRSNPKYRRPKSRKRAYSKSR